MFYWVVNPQICSLSRLLARAGLIGCGHAGATLQMQEPHPPRSAANGESVANSMVGILLM